ncbi:hypothetical protein L484_005298 [Morus notabilis]|uniref:BHLH domain-containing protein n=1 Tax=Morus notabilis TaxID=981085 RepID=W9R062_9ROSA|nr:transcription factor PRE4 [Morus notabilis]EXB49962.1 hypothetical protein L484_005298 [Morus notabilis]
MSNRSSSRSSFKPTDEEINELILKLQALLPDLLNQQRSTTTVAASTILEETCNYIKKLRREVGSLSERLSQLLDSSDIADVHELIRGILQQ